MKVVERKSIRFGKIRFIHADCMDWLREVDFQFYHLASVDPPYGIEADKWNLGTTADERAVSKVKRSKYQKESWDTLTPKQEYFDEIFRCSRNQIIWGANYYFSKIKKDSERILIWDKEQPQGLSFADFELAWTSFKGAPKKIRRSRVKDAKHEKIHQTQKPVYLYDYCFSNFTKRGDKVIDTHGGSHNAAIAAFRHDLNFDIIELNEEFHLKGIENFDRNTFQCKLDFFS